MAKFIWVIRKVGGATSFLQPALHLDKLCCHLQVAFQPVDALFEIGDGDVFLLPNQLDTQSSRPSQRENHMDRVITDRVLRAHHTRSIGRKSRDPRRSPSYGASCGPRLLLSSRERRPLALTRCPRRRADRPSRQPGCSRRQTKRPEPAQSRHPNSAVAQRAQRRALCLPAPAICPTQLARCATPPPPHQPAPAEADGSSHGNHARRSSRRRPHPPGLAQGQDRGLARGEPGPVAAV